MDRRGSSSSWFDGDFDETDEFLLAAVQPSIPAASVKKKGYTTYGKRRKVSEDQQSWCDRYAPSSPADLAVQPKKVQEIRSWIQVALSSTQSRSVLALVGPSGCGKTAVVRTLSSELRLNLRHWAETSEDSKGIHAFSTFIRQASRYTSLLEDDKKRNLVLLEEWPPSISREGVEEILLRLGGLYAPLVLIFSEEAGRNAAELLDALSAHKISLNPITNTHMIKALKRIATSESSSGVRPFPIPEQGSLLSLAEACKGDIRAAIHSLQFKCSGKRSSTTKSSSGKKSNKTTSLEIKDPSLDLFHALGKVLYAKRTEEMEPSKSLLLSKESRLRRRVLKSDPEDILDFAPISSEGLTSFLHQNYMDFFQDIGDLSQASECLSLSDPFFVWNMNAISSKVSLPEFGGQISVRGLLYHNTQVKSSFRGLKTFSKPEIYAVNRKCRATGQKARSMFLPRSLSSTELFTNFLPLLKKVNPSSSGSWEDGAFTQTATISEETSNGEQNNEDEDFIIEDFD